MCWSIACRTDALRTFLMMASLRAVTSQLMAYFMIDLLGTETAAGVFMTARLSLIEVQV